MATTRSRKILFSPIDRRGAGLLLHPTSLPSTQGLGVLGPEVFTLIDFMVEARLHFWQVLPLGPTGYGDSPYQSFSAFAGNPYLIDVEPLVAARLLTETDLQPLRNLPASEVDYGGLFECKWDILFKAYQRFAESSADSVGDYGSYKEFCRDHASWLKPYCLFMALKAHFGGKPHYEWPREFRNYAEATLEKLTPDTETLSDAHAFYQYLFDAQWQAVKAYAAEREIEIVGDIPIFVAYDGADFWTHPDLFMVDSKGKPSAVAGVPPDYFSKTGQLWGNPLYDWEALGDEKYKWWIQRLRHNLHLFDIIRIDHFRAFYDFWAIPADAPDARSGKWLEGPGYPFFQVVKRRLPKAKLIAEDLGDLHDEVLVLRDETGLPGMNVLHFAFDRNGKNSYLPHNHVANSIVYAGTHDNDTTRGWYDSQPEPVCDQVRRMLRVSGEDISWDLIRMCYYSVATIAVVSAQDILMLGSEARMNTPGVLGGNWSWRMSDTQFSNLQKSSDYLRELAWLSGRGPGPETKAEPES